MDPDPARFGPSLPVDTVSARPDSRQPMTVSARIHTFDDQRGCTLFAPNKAGTMSGAEAGTMPQWYAGSCGRIGQRPQLDARSQPEIAAPLLEDPSRSLARFVTVRFIWPDSTLA